MINPTPEEKARTLIDHMLKEAGWDVVDRKDSNASLPSAVRESMLAGNHRADYLLFIDNKVVGVLEAKREEIDVRREEVVRQAVGYASSLPDRYDRWEGKDPSFIYLSNGKDLLRKDGDQLTELTSMDRPIDIAISLGMEHSIAPLPRLIDTRGTLRDCQFAAITAAESAFRNDQKRILFALATGAGKTFTACTVCYRLLTYTTAIKRVLFLVDRNNLGEQANSEFSNFRLTEDGLPFTNTYGVTLLKSGGIPGESSVVISTIQRLYSELSGESYQEEIDTNEDEVGCLEWSDPTPVLLPEKPKIPCDFFDLIIIDESHRSIYGKWGRVLQYFNNAYFIGLTATPNLNTYGFFDRPTYSYPLAQSIADGINVGPRKYTIRTDTQIEGGTIHEGDKITVQSRYTGQTTKKLSELNTDYTKFQLNQSVFNPEEVRVVLQAYKDRLYTDLFPDRAGDTSYDYIPKTLIFAQNERHAAMIVEVAKQVFGRPPEDKRFVQQITYSVGNSWDLIRSFRTDKDFRIAVSVTLVATGTDIKPLEVLIFMRDVQSETLYIQMVGRGVRSIDDEKLRLVTPNATSKECFYIIDAMDVTGHGFTLDAPTLETGERLPTLEQLLEYISLGDLEDNNLLLLGQRMARISKRSTESQSKEFSELTGKTIQGMAGAILSGLESGKLPPYDKDHREYNSQRKDLVYPLPSCPEARKLLLEINAGYITTLHPGESKLVSVGFSYHQAEQSVSAFENYVSNHQDEIDALRLIRDSQVITYDILYDLSEKLIRADAHFESSALWRDYETLLPERVIRPSTKDEWHLMTNVVQLVRFALRMIDRLYPLTYGSGRLFELWAGQLQRETTETQKQLMREVVDVITTNGYVTIDALRNSQINIARLVSAYGDRRAADEALQSLANFLIYPKELKA